MQFSLKNYVSTFFRTFIINKSGIFIFILFSIFYSFSAVIQLIIDVGYSDEKKIILGLTDGLLAVLFQVVFYNYYFSKLSEMNYSFKKSLWDITKYLFTSLILSLCLIAGVIFVYFSLHLISPFLAMILTGLFVVIYLMNLIYLPMISILFDHYKVELSDTKKLLSLIKNNMTFYIGLLLFVFLVTIVELSLNELLFEMPIAVGLKIISLLALSMVSMFSSALMINYFLDSSRKVNE